MIGPTTVTIASNGTTTATGEARGPRAERFTIDIVKQPTSLADSLTRAAKSLADALAVLMGWRRVQAITFENVTCPASGPVTLAHGLGRFARWSVVDWQGAANPILTRATATTTEQLVLTSGSAGTASIEVW